MRFKFRLKRLLELRDADVERCEKMLGVAIRATRTAESELQGKQAAQREHDTAWAEAMRAQIKGDTMMDFHNERLKLINDERSLQETVLKARQHELDCKKELERALAKQKSLQKLQERARLKHEAEARRLEQAQLDEFGITSTARKD